MFDGILQPTHLLIILAICLLIFGPQKLPQLGKGLGESIREFKRAISDAGNSNSNATQAAPAATPEEKK